MALNAGSCAHASWRTDFAANGKLHQFCVACGAERRVSQPAEDAEAARLRNGLRWLRHVAAMNLLGDTCGPQQMRMLTVLAEKVLDGAELGDYDSSIGTARSKTQEWAASVGVDLPTTDQLRPVTTDRPSADSLPEPRARAALVQADPVQADPAQADPVQGNRVQGNRVQGNRVQGNRVQADRVQADPVQPAPPAERDRVIVLDGHPN